MCDGAQWVARYNSSMNDSYIPRMLYSREQALTEAQLIATHRVLIVLAEPGGGKTSLLRSFARKLNTVSQRASIFRSRSALKSNSGLIIDAIDEMARIDKLATEQLIVKASEEASGPVIFASRSSEWDTALTQYVQDCFGVEPFVVRLQPFDEAEQRVLFSDWFPGQAFDAFLTEARRFDLTPLLGNPQFLFLFGEAFIAENRFWSKAQIFAAAITRLACEKPDAAWGRARPPLEDILFTAGQVFTNILLSGATGVSAVENLDDRDFPFLKALSREALAPAELLLDTRLFKPSDDVNQHEPMHRIVAEYCAASYLAARINNGGDRLSFARVLSVIAPNGVVRDELRGMLGWIAACGNETVQRAAIELDAYAVLANGDPAQLSLSSKKRLLLRLREISHSDPYFRRSDQWRRFNVGQFFDGGIIEDVRPLLRPSQKDKELQELLLELLAGSLSAAKLQPEISGLLVGADVEISLRVRALRVLLDIPAFSGEAEFQALIAENTRESLKMASEILIAKGVAHFGHSETLRLIRHVVSLYEHRRGRSDRQAGSRYFITQLVDSFSLQDIVCFLDTLTNDLSCTCGAKTAYRCDCRTGISKIAGRLLDRYFQTSEGPHDARQIAAWIFGLNFPEGGRSYNDLASVQTLHANTELRQAVQRIAFEAATSDEAIESVLNQSFSSGMHAGFRFFPEDFSVLAEHAFETGNVPLWKAIFPGHNRYQGKEPNPLRAQMRQHTRLDARFMAVWAKFDRGRKALDREQRRSWPMRNRRYEQRQAREKEQSFEHLRANRSLIESGRHWGWLQSFAHCYLSEPDKLAEVVDDIGTAKKALSNCFDFLMPHVPSLELLADRQGYGVTYVLHAACLLYFREHGSLEGIAEPILLAIKTDTGGRSGFAEGEEEAFEAEIDRLLFQQPGKAEAFLRAYLEPQLASQKEPSPNVGMLGYKACFHALRSTLALEWLRRYPRMPYHAMLSLFDMAAQYGDRAELTALIRDRYAEIRTASVLDDETDKEAQHRREHWCLSSFFFEDDPTAAWEELKSEPKNIFLFSNRIGRLGTVREKVWPALSGDKIYLIFDGFAAAWPAVHLPNSYGTGDPDDEQAYRFLTDLVWRIRSDPPNKASPVLERMLTDSRFASFEKELKTIHAEMRKNLALQDFRPPSPKAIASLLHAVQIASVEDLRALLTEELENLQQWLRGEETDPIVQFYPAGKRVDENTARNRIVDRLKSRLSAMNLSVVIEHQMVQSNRCDFTAAAMIDGRRSLLVTEVKGQWHRELFTAAREQLDKRYAIHPDAAGQGVYLVLWFGGDETIAGIKSDTITSPAALREEIIARMPAELRSVIAVFVLDLSGPGDKPRKKGHRRSLAAEGVR